MNKLKNCLQCGNEFEYKRSDKKFCSKKCGSKYKKDNKPFPTQARLHELFEVKFNDENQPVIISKVDRINMKKGQILKQTEYINNKGKPSEGIRLQVMVDYYTIEIGAFIYIYFNGDYDRKKLQIDHIDNNPINNHPDNLQAISASANNKRKPGYGSSSFKGVAWHKATNKWHVQVKINGGKIHGGLFEDEYEAARAADKLLMKSHNDISVLNFPYGSDTRILDQEPPADADFESEMKLFKATQAYAEKTGSTFTVEYCQ